jgi:hypothetical protein
MRAAAAERMRARNAAMTPKQRAELQAKQDAGRVETKARRAGVDTVAPPESKAKVLRASVESSQCTGPCPFIREVVTRVATALLAELPTGQDHEAQRVALLAVKMARTPSRDPRWFEAMSAVHRAATEYAEHHPAIKRQVDKGEDPT